MPIVTLIRHGQAGTRDNYDLLSEAGAEQAGLLGDWLKARSIGFDAAISGALRRQRETAGAVLQTGRADALRIDPAWNEFDLDAVFRGVAGKLAAADEGFARRWAAVLAEVEAGGAEIHRRWTPADGEVMDAWIGGRFGRIDGVESWQDFRSRIRRALEALRGAGAQSRIAVFTSALPASFCAAEALNLDDRAILELAGASYNTGVSTIWLDGPATKLLTFNAACHLPDRLLTFR